MKNDLAKTERLDLEAAQRSDPTPMELMAQAIEKGMTPEALEKLYRLKRDIDADNAKRLFAKAFTELQAEMPIIQACRVVPNKDGSERYKYAPYEDIMRQAQPLLKRFGFTVSFSTVVDGNRVRAICILLHKGGHERTNEYAVRIGGGPPGSTEMQADGAAYTYAQRGALCDCLGITISGRDNDARDLGANVSHDQCEDLRQRVADAKLNVTSFLKWAGATSFETIPETSYRKLDDYLKGKGF